MRALTQLRREAYLEQNQREYKIPKQLSLQLFNPLALIALKQSGICEVALPESLFDADSLNHFMRRLNHPEIRGGSLDLACSRGVEAKHINRRGRPIGGLSPTYWQPVMSMLNANPRSW